MLSVEDITEPSEDLLVDETFVHPDTKKSITHKVMNIEKVVGRIVDTMVAREKEGKNFGVITLAEGLAEYLPAEHTVGVKRDEHGHLSIADVNFGKLFAKAIAKAYKARTGNDRKVTGVTLGYESRCAIPTAFDVLLGSALGVGAFRALYEKGLDEVMVSTVGQLELRFVPFDELIERDTMKTKTRYITFGSDFHKLARFLETYVHV